MIKRVLSIAVFASILALGAQAQSKTDNVETTSDTKVVNEDVKPFTPEEEATEKKKILSYEEKVMANKDNDAIDFKAELKRIAEMKERFNKRAATKLD